MKIDTTAVVTGAVVVGGLLLLSSRASAAVGEAAARARAAVVPRVTPSSRDNLVYQGASGVADILDDGADNQSTTLGGSIFRWFNPEDAAATAEYLRQGVKP